jgi:hypothetical protein
MEIYGILFNYEGGRLTETAAAEISQENFKEHLSLRGAVFRKDFHPGPAFLALRQVGALSCNLGIRHLFVLS